MHDALAVQVPNCKSNLGSVELYNFLTQALLCFKNFVELSTFNERHHKVEPCLRLEEIVHSDKEGVITAEKNVFFELGVLHLIVLNKHIFPNSFDGVEFLLLDKFCKIYFTKSSSSEKHF